MTTYGYMRVSTDQQDTALQAQALDRAGAGEFVSDVMSGKTTSRPGLDGLLSRIKPGDTLMVWKLDRLGRSSAHIIALIDDLTRRGVHFKSLTENFDTTSPMGRAMVGVMAVFAQLERETISQRVKEGLVVAKANGKVLGAPKKHDAALEAAIREAEGSIRDIARQFGVPKTTVHELRQMPNEQKKT